MTSNRGLRSVECTIRNKLYTYIYQLAVKLYVYYLTRNQEIMSRTSRVPPHSDRRTWLLIESANHMDVMSAGTRDCNQS